MDYLELMKRRYSVRRFCDTPVEREKLDRILEAGRLAPTGCNYQPQRIYLLQTPEALERLRSVSRMVANKRAPIAMLVCYDVDVAWRSTVDTFGDDCTTGETDAAIVTTSMMMQATELGLGTLWVRGYRTRDIVEEFGIPINHKLVSILLVGYPAAGQTPDYPGHTERLPLSATVKEL